MDTVNSCLFCNDNERQENPLTELKICKQCNKEYCVIHSSKVDPQYCQDCNNDVVVIDKIFNKTTQEYDEFNDEIVLKASRCRIIKLEGEHWKFYSRQIEGLSDEELSRSIQYHKALVAKMELENEFRKVAKLQTTIRLNKAAGTVISSTTTEKRTTRTLKQKPVPDLAAIAAALKAAGITSEMIAALKAVK